MKFLLCFLLFVVFLLLVVSGLFFLEFVVCFSCERGGVAVCFRVFSDLGACFSSLGACLICVFQCIRFLFLLFFVGACFGFSCPFFTISWAGAQFFADLCAPCFMG